MIRAKDTVEGTGLRRKLGLSVPLVILLAAIAAIRVPFHDLGIVSEGSVARLLVFVPLAIWLTVVLARRSECLSNGGFPKSSTFSKPLCQSIAWACSAQNSSELSIERR